MDRWRHEAAPATAVQIAAVVLLWVALFEINHGLFSTFEVTAFANWVFLPAGLRVVAILLLGWKGVAGLFLGALWTNHPVVGVNLLESVALSSASALAPYLGVQACRRLLRCPPDWNGLAAKHLLGLALVCAALSAQAHNLYFLLATGTHRSLVALLPMFTGDVLGTLLVFWMAHPWLKRLQPR